ncbi:hypothetical protein FLA105534_04868 [Flavobacterium bizetiae]|uniref:Uncharacterized protein n=1 Tax=Flavobacterium bizetiae TaxID=2704140 RepID=A0A6J4GZG1_9FLAO|nr:hypothetical protein FLA105534_04868 [Flavobacterium bizetiae]CAD5344940.1 hypothetical protein FLA105535_04952 [Flavobacterium bizetiae]CAD5350906.1 hypothetical protein FLA105534_04907 [Flavobacterium bizetiae]
MQKISLKNVKSALSRKEMRAISGGYSVLYCSWHSIGFGTYYDYDKCRQSRVGS